LNALDDPKVQGVLAREHELAKGDSERLASVRTQIDAAKAAGEFTYDIFPKDVYLSIEPDMGVFLNLCAKTIGAKCIVEFGASFGISTIYLAAAARDLGGHVISSELEASKAEKARANLAEAGLSDYAEIRIGDAMETLKDIEGPVDLLFLDGWKDLYVPVAKMMEPRLRPGSLMLADNIYTFPEDLKSYLDYVSAPEGPYRSLTLPFESGLGYSLYLGS
jgi:predicted O-methyltransferase YrrM